MSAANREAAVLLHVKPHMKQVIVKQSNSKDSVNTATKLQKLRVDVFSLPTKLYFPGGQGNKCGTVSCIENHRCTARAGKGSEL